MKFVLNKENWSKIKRMRRKVDIIKYNIIKYNNI